MTRALVVQTALFVIVGIAAMFEGVRLSRDPSGLQQMLGPGVYVFVLGLLLAVVGAFHLMIEGRKHADAPPDVLSHRDRMRLVGLAGTLSATVFLIEIVGYVAATTMFFVAAFRILGVRSWLTNIALSGALMAVFYLMFVWFAGVAFPHGRLVG